LRGCLIKYILNHAHNDTLIAQTLANYGFNAVYMECNPFAFFGLDVSFFQDMINACKKYNLTFHVLLKLEAGTGPDYTDAHENYGYNLTGYRSSWCTALENGTSTGFISFSADAARNRIKQVVQTLLTFFPDIVDLNIDYVRYPTSDLSSIPNIHYRVPYDDASKTAFLAWLTANGKNFSGNWSDYYHGGLHWTDFATWRINPINDIVRDIRAWALAVKPTVMITADVWTPYYGWTPDEYKEVMGQDPAYWISQGWIDSINPMNYVSDLATLQYRMTQESTYWLGGTAKGAIPLVPFITQGGPGADVSTPISNSTWLQQINYLRQSGANGFIIWAYDGPGLDESWTDITPYLALIRDSSQKGAFPVFRQTNPTVLGSTITWQTSLPTTGKIEYSLTQMFSATPKNGTLLPYVKIDYIPGTILSESAPTQTHSITVPLSPPFYYRVRDNDTNVELASPVYLVTG
jgi:hypothetical protein